MRKKLAIVLAAALTFNSFGAFADELAIDDIAIEDSFEDVEEFAEEEVVEEEFDEETSVVAEDEGVSIDEIGDELFEEFDETAEDVADVVDNDSEDAVVKVTTTNGTVSYDSFEEALQKITENDANVVLTLNANVKIDATKLEGVEEKKYTISRPMTIVLGDYTLDETDVELVGTIEDTVRPTPGKICRGETVSGSKVTRISFASHTVTAVCTWDKDERGNYYVSKVTESCTSCGNSYVVLKSDNTTWPTTLKTWPDATYNSDTGTYTFTASGEGYNWSGTKTVTVETKGYTFKSVQIKQVSGVNMHSADGLPEISAKVTEVSSTKDVDATVAITQATQEELAETGVTVYTENGTTSYDGEKKPVKDPTCEETGVIIYKVVVSDPDGKEAAIRFLADQQAIAKINHVKGALYGYQLLSKSDASSASETAAKNAAKEAGKTVYKVSKEVNNSGKTVYYYWYWDDSAIKYVAGSEGQTYTQSIAVKVEDSELVPDVDGDGVFVYRPIYFCDLEDFKYSEFNKMTKIIGDAVEVEPYANATTSSEYALPTYSKCTSWLYPSVAITYECSDATNSALKNTYTYSVPVKEAINKPASAYSHVSDGTKYTTDPTANSAAVRPTCTSTGKAVIICGICGSPADEAAATVTVSKLAHTYGIYDEDAEEKKLNALTVSDIDEDLNNTNHTVAFDEVDNVTVATVSATCAEAGGVYWWCTGDNNMWKGDTVDFKDGTKVGHWEKQSEIDALGHDLSYIVVPAKSNWDVYDADGEIVSNGIDSAYNEAYDYTYRAHLACRHVEIACEGQDVVYHSIDGKDKYDQDGVYHVYNAVTVTDEEVGADCQTYPNTIYTVSEITNTIGGSVTYEAEKTTGKKGDHVYKVTAWEWSANFEAATATAECTVKGCTDTINPQVAKVTKETSEDGITTFTATFGDYTDVKTAYTLHGAKVTYDTSAITDGNLVEGSKASVAVDGEDELTYTEFAPQLPEVTVTVNGTVIDSSLYKVTWKYENYIVSAEVDWVDSVKKSKAVDGVVNENASAATYKVGANETFASDDIETIITQNGEDMVDENKNYEIAISVPYDPNDSYAVASTIANGSVKYAITSEEVVAKNSELKLDNWATQKKIEALDYNLDEVKDISTVGKYYIYAQISGEGYTTYTGLIAYINIYKQEIMVYVDNASVVEGELPNLHIRAVDYYHQQNEIEINPADFLITTVGGESLENLKVGVYRLRVTTENYIVHTSEADYVAVLTVLAKDNSTPEEQAKAEAVVALINSLDNENPNADDVKTARAAYDALTDTAKTRVDADTLKKLTDAEKAVADEAAEAAKKAAIEAANAAAGSAEGAAEAAAVTPNTANLKAAADAVAAAEKAIADAKAAGATDADLAEASKATAIAKADQAAAAAVADPSKANVDAANAAVAAAKAAGATDNELTTALKNQSAAAAANKDAVDKAVAAANTAAQKAASTGSEADIKAAQAAIDAAKKAGATDAQLADANKNLKAGQDKLAAATAKKNATVKASKSTVKKGKKATVKITSDSTGKITVTAKNKKAKNKKFVKIKKNGKVVFTKKAKKGTYKFTVKVAAAGNYKATTKVIKIKVK